MDHRPKYVSKKYRTSGIHAGKSDDFVFGEEILDSTPKA